jgi:hypothetical protein
MVGGLPSVGWANGSKALAAAMVVLCYEFFLDFVVPRVSLERVVPLPA